MLRHATLSIYSSKFEKCSPQFGSTSPATKFALAELLVFVILQAQPWWVLCPGRTKYLKYKAEGWSDLQNDWQLCQSGNLSLLGFEFALDPEYSVSKSMPQGVVDGVAEKGGWPHYWISSHLIYLLQLNPLSASIHLIIKNHFMCRKLLTGCRSYLVETDPVGPIISTTIGIRVTRTHIAAIGFCLFVLIIWSVTSARTLISPNQSIVVITSRRAVIKTS